MNAPHTWKVAGRLFTLMICASVVMLNLACEAPSEPEAPVQAQGLIEAEETRSVVQEDEAMTLTITSSAFAEGEPIPKKYTGEGSDVSPPLQWTDAPPGVRSFALICDDPDAPVGIWVHWVVYNIPPGSNGLPEAVPIQDKLPDGTQQGKNDFGNIGYGGPMPPPGKPHRYYFKLYALDMVLDLPKQVKKKGLEKAMKEHVLAEGQLMGTYQR